jgi:hypothetical protein
MPDNSAVGQERLTATDARPVPFAFEQAAQALKHVDDAVPGPRTALVLALLGGVVALLLLLGRAVAQGRRQP